MPWRWVLYFSSLRNHPEATQSKNANFIFDSNWRYQKPKPENAWEVFWCVARRRQMKRGCPWRLAISEGSYISQCHLSSSVWCNQRCLVHRSGWVLRILEFSLSLPLSLFLLPFLFSPSFSFSPSLSLFTQCLAVGLCIYSYLLQQEVPLVADKQGVSLGIAECH